MAENFKLYSQGVGRDYEVPFYPGWKEAIENNKSIKTYFLNGREIEVIKHKPKESVYPQYYHVNGYEICLYFWHQLIEHTEKNKTRIDKIWKINKKIRKLKDEINSEIKKMSYLEKK